MRTIKILVLFLLFVPTIASAEIEKTAQTSAKGICLAWWPKMDPVNGWHHEREPSIANGINVQVPDGFTFSDAETVIYATGLYKPRVPETTTLEMLINKDKEEFFSKDPGITITEERPIKTGDGNALKSYTFFPNEKGNWEQVSYGEEGDFYLIFTISSRSHEGYKKAFEVYKQYIDQYKEKP